MALKDVPGIMDAITNIFGQQQQAKQGAEQVRRNKADEALRQAQMTQAQAIADRQADLRSRELDIEHEQADVATRSLAQAGVQRAFEALKGGASAEDIEKMYQVNLRQLAPKLMESMGQPNATGNSTLPQATPQIQPQQNNPVQFRPTPDQSPTGATQPTQPANGVSPDLGERLRTTGLQQIQAVEQAKAQGTENVAGPVRAQEAVTQAARDKRLNDYQVAREGTQNQLQKDLLNIKQVFEAGESAKDRTAAMDRAKLSSGTENSIANINNKTNVMRIGAEYGVDPSTAFNIGQDIYGGGGEKKDDKNPIMRRIAAPWEEQGYKDPGTDIDEIKKLDSIQTQDLPAFKDFAVNYLKPTGIGTKWQQGLSKIWPTDAKAAEAEVGTRFQSVGKGLEDFPGSRQLANAFKIESGSIPSLGDTQDQGLGKVQFLDNMANGRKYKIVSQYTPKQRELFQARNPGTDFNIKMKTPGGKIVSVPPAKLEEAISQGGKVVQ